jgi:hypothetical protein
MPGIRPGYVMGHRVEMENGLAVCSNREAHQSGAVTDAAIAAI